MARTPANSEETGCADVAHEATTPSGDGVKLTRTVSLLPTGREVDGRGIREGKKKLEALAAEILEGGSE